MNPSVWEGWSQYWSHNNSLESACETVFDAVEQEKPKILRRLIKSKKDANRSGEEGFTPLTLAMHSCAGRFVFETLLEKKADVGMIDAHGNTVLHYGIEYNNLHIFELLDRSGVFPCVVIADREGQTPLEKVMALYNTKGLWDCVQKKSGLFLPMQEKCKPLIFKEVSRWVIEPLSAIVVDYLFWSEKDFIEGSWKAEKSTDANDLTFPDIN
jgi:hypothetical protein